MATRSKGTSPIFKQSTESYRQLSDCYVSGNANNIQNAFGGSSTSTNPRVGNLWKALKSVRIRTLFYSSLVAVVGSLSFGYVNGFSSPTLPDLDENSDGGYTYFNKTVYHDLFNALAAVGGLLGAPIAGWSVDNNGRQFTMVLCSVPLTIGWLLILITHGITGPLFRPLLFVGRILTGAGIGSISLVVPLYIAEISPRDLRGLFGAMNQLAVTIGVLLVQALGIGLNYEWLCIGGLVIMLVFVPLTAMTLRESPRWLISQGRNLQAGKVLAWLRGPNFNVNKEQMEIEAQLASEETLTFAEKFRVLATRPAFHPLVLAMLLMFFQQFSGVNAVIFNGQQIIEQAGVNNAAVMATVTIGIAQVVATLIGVILTDILGRKVLLITGGAIMCLSMAVLSVYDLLKNEPYCDPPHDPKCKDNLQPLAITAVMCYIIGFSIGWGALPWLMASELIPMRVRGTGVGIATFVNWTCAAIVLGFFGSYQNLVMPWGTFLTFCVICLLSIIFVAVFTPETKGRSLEEIEGYFNRRNNKQYAPL